MNGLPFAYDEVAGGFMNKKVLCFVLSLSIGAAACFPTGVFAENEQGEAVQTVQSDALGVSAQSAALIEADSGRVIFVKNGEERLPIASTTKIMTALLTLEASNLDTYFTVDPNAIKVEGTSIDVYKRQIIKPYMSIVNRLHLKFFVQFYISNFCLILSFQICAIVNKIFGLLK